MTTCMRFPGSQVAIKFGHSFDEVSRAVRQAIELGIVATFGSATSAVIVDFRKVGAVELTPDLPDGTPSVAGSVAEMQR